MRVMFFICVFLTCGLLFCFLWIDSLRKDNKRLQEQNNGFKIEIARREEVANNVREREKVVEKLVYKDKEVFDWRADISNTAVVNELRKQCKSCSVAKH